MRRAAAVLTVVLAACGGAIPPYATHFAAAERAESAGRYEEAARAYDAATTDATAPARERDHARWLAGLMWLRAGDVAQGAAHLRAVAAGGGQDAPEAALRLARIHLAHGDPAALDELDAVALRFSQSGAALQALRARLIQEDERGPEQALAYLHAIRAKLDAGGKTSELDDFVAYSAAERVARAGRTAEARDAFVAVAQKWPYPKAYFDDALFRASELDEKLGRYQAAVDDLRRMLSVRESSTLPGSYDRPRFPAGAFRIAVLLRDRLGRPDEAHDAFVRFARDFDTSVLVDDALWNAAALERARGDADAACDDLADLVGARPDSRYVPCAVKQCKDIERPKESRAPKTCRAYITRRQSAERRR